MKFLTQDKSQLFILEEALFSVHKLGNGEAQIQLISTDRENHGRILGVYSSEQTAKNVLSEAVLATESYSFPQDCDVEIGTRKKINTYEAGCFFINCFDRIRHDYYCDKIKLQKMLIISQMVYYSRYKEDLITDMRVQYSKQMGFLIDMSKLNFRHPISDEESAYKCVEGSIQNKRLFFGNGTYITYRDRIFDDTHLDEDNEIRDFSPSKIPKTVREFLSETFLAIGGWSENKMNEELSYLKSKPSFPVIREAVTDIPNSVFHNTIREWKNLNLIF